MLKVKLSRWRQEDDCAGGGRSEEASGEAESVIAERVRVAWSAGRRRRRNWWWLMVNRCFPLSRPLEGSEHTQKVSCPRGEVKERLSSNGRAGPGTRPSPGLIEVPTAAHPRTCFRTVQIEFKLGFGPIESCSPDRKSVPSSPPLTRSVGAEVVRRRVEGSRRCLERRPEAVKEALEWPAGFRRGRPS